MAIVQAAARTIRALETQSLILITFIRGHLWQQIVTDYRVLRQIHRLDTAHPAGVFYRSQKVELRHIT